MSLLRCASAIFRVGSDRIGLWESVIRAVSLVSERHDSQLCSTGGTRAHLSNEKQEAQRLEYRVRVLSNSSGNQFVAAGTLIKRGEL